MKCFRHAANIQELISVDLMITFYQLQIKANELQARHQREKEREVVMTAHQSVPTSEGYQLTECE